MAYGNVDKAYIFRFLGFSSVQTQSDPRIAAAITASQSIADGGSQVDSTTENEIKCHIYGWPAVTGSLPTPGGASSTGPYASPAKIGLLQIEADIANLRVQQGALAAGKVKIDPAREMLRLRSDGRRLVGSMAILLGLRGARADVFAPGRVIRADDEPDMTYESPFHT